MKIVVIGGSGLIGSRLVGRLRQGGHEVIAASPASGVNTVTGDGLPAVGARLKVRGEVLVGITVGATRYGTSLQEAGRDYLD